MKLRLNDLKKNDVIVICKSTLTRSIYVDSNSSKLDVCTSPFELAERADDSKTRRRLGLT